MFLLVQGGLIGFLVTLPTQMNKNGNGPDRYRTQADDPEKQVCYFNKQCNDEL